MGRHNIRKLKPKEITFKAPTKNKIIRVKKAGYRSYLLDLRGIKSSSPVTADDWAIVQGKKISNYKGEKPAFLSAKDLEEEIERYFESCFGPVILKDGTYLRNENGDIVKTQKKPFTVAGLALYIGMTTVDFNKYARKCYDDWATDEQDKLYSAIIARAKQRIEEYSETRLYDREGVNGARFVLGSHFKMVDRMEESQLRERERLLEIREKELEMKQKAFEMGDSDEDTAITINIVSKEDDNE